MLTEVRPCVCEPRGISVLPLLCDDTPESTNLHSQTTRQNLLFARLQPWYSVILLSLESLTRKKLRGITVGERIPVRWWGLLWGEYMSEGISVWRGYCENGITVVWGDYCEKGITVVCWYYCEKGITVVWGVLLWRGWLLPHLLLPHSSVSLSSNMWHNTRVHALVWCVLSQATTEPLQLGIV